MILLNPKDCDCGGICDREGFQAVIDALKERLAWKNGGTLPTTSPVGWADESYPLNLIFTIGSAPGENPCLGTRHVDEIIAALQEIDAWLYGRTALHYLYSGGWINTDVHADADIEDAATVTNWTASDYDTMMDGWRWFRAGYGSHGGYTTADGDGQLGGYGEVDAVKYGDTDEHVDAHGGDFCQLVSDTLDQMLAALQKLVGVNVTGGQTEESWKDADIGGDETCSSAKASVKGQFEASWNQYYYEPTTIGTYDFSITFMGSTDWVFSAFVQRGRGKLTADLAPYASGTASIYILASPWGGAGAGHEDDVPGMGSADGTYHSFEEATPGSVYESELLNDHEEAPSFTFDCPENPPHGSGWAISSVVAVVKGDFVA